MHSVQLNLFLGELFKQAPHASSYSANLRALQWIAKDKINKIESFSIENLKIVIIYFIIFKELMIKLIKNLN